MRGRTTLGVFLAIAAALVGAGAARGAPIASEDFIDGNGDGELAGENGGSGWSAAWSANTGGTQLVPVSYAYTVPGGGKVRASSALEVTGSGDNGSLVSRGLSAAPSGDVYISFLLNFAEGSIGNNDFNIWWFGNASGPNIGVKGNRGNGSGPEDVTARTKGGAEAYSQDLVVGTTYFVVGHLYKDGAGNYDRYELWVNPSWYDADNPQAVSMTTGDIASFSTVGMRRIFFESNDKVHYAALRIGTTWDDVVPVPEPATLALAALGLGGLVGYLRRRRKRTY